MNSTCPSCGITYRVDPAKVPAGGIRARCTRCDGVFKVQLPSAPAGAESAPAPPPAPEPEPAAGPTPAASEPARPVGPSAAPHFGVADPHGKARRLARALVSDIVVYHPERRERAMAAGTLRQEFRDEVRKSWDEYVAQVGDPLARGTPYFREALNEILAGGNAVF